MLHSLRRLAALVAITVAMAGLAVRPATAASRAPTVAARAAVLADASTGAVLWQRNAHTPMLVASTTKMLTALVAEATYPPAKLLTVPLAAEQVDGTRFGYRTGMRIRRHDLLATLLLVSANDAAETLAAAYPRGGRAGFLLAMQAMADSLGCTDSTWRSPSGLEAPGHRASAADLAIVGRQLLAEPELAQLVGARTARYRWPDGRVQIITNHNHFVGDGRDRGAIGVKTGYTEAAGRTIVAAERRGGRTLIAVALGVENLETERADVRAMLRYGFATLPPPGAEILGAAAVARQGATTGGADLSARDGPVRPAPAAGASRSLVSRLLAAPAVLAVAAGVLLGAGMLAIALLPSGQRKRAASRPARRGRRAPAPPPRSRARSSATARRARSATTAPLEGGRGPTDEGGPPAGPPADRVSGGRARAAGRYGDRAP